LKTTINQESSEFSKKIKMLQEELDLLNENKTEENAACRK
jgi:hypothetical protein